MSANLEWGVPFSIVSGFGELFMNGTTPYLLLQDNCEAMRRLRVVVDDIPQADGQINHRRFTAGYEVQLEVALWNAARDKPLCDAEARAAAEALMLHLNRILNDPGRLFWTPEGLGDQRFLDEARLSEVGPWTFGEVGDPRIVFRLDSPFPYVMDFAQVEIELADNVAQDVFNIGTVETFPVIRVDGPTSDFTIFNAEADPDGTLVYSASLPGAVPIGSGDFLELDFFRNTAYLNGAGQSRKAGIDIEQSDFWPILPGNVANNLLIVGADATVLYNHSYA
jgi:hypothetical protein